MSGWRTCGSSVGSASKTISERDSVTSITASASSSSVNSSGLPMLTGRWTSDSAIAMKPRDQVVDVAEAARLAAVAEDGQRLVLERLAQEGRDRAAVVRAHPRAVGVEDPHDAGVDALLAVVGHRQRLGVALRLVVDAARADRVDVAPVGLRLGVDLRVAVDLGGGGEQEAGALELRQAEHVVGAVGADLERVQRQAQVVDRAGRRGEVVDEVDRLVDVERLGQVVLQEGEVARRAMCSMFCSEPVSRLSTQITRWPLLEQARRRGGSRGSRRRR